MNNNVQKKNTKLVTHVTRGNVLDELDLDEQELLELKMKADLHQDILKLIKKKKITPRQLEKLFDIPQPRVSELLRGKLSLLSVSKLLYYAHLLGAHSDVKLKPSVRAGQVVRQLAG
jgi:predicted XRE-type DNA-binding protein